MRHTHFTSAAEYYAILRLDLVPINQNTSLAAKSERKWYFGSEGLFSEGNTRPCAVYLSDRLLLTRCRSEKLGIISNSGEKVSFDIIRNDKITYVKIYFE